MPEVNRSTLERGDKIRYRDPSKCSGWTEVRIEEVAKGRKRLAVEKAIYNGCHGQQTGSECYGIDIGSVIEVQRWVKVGNSEETEVQAQESRVYRPGNVKRK